MRLFIAIINWMNLINKVYKNIILSNKDMRSKNQTSETIENDADQRLLTKVRYRSFSKILLMILNLCLSPFYFGYTIQYLGTFDFKTIMDIYGITFSQKVAEGLYNGLVPVGAGVGALTSFLLIKNFSRKNSLLIVNALALAFGLMIFIKNPYSFLVVRIMQGACTGFYSAIAPLIIKQFSPTEIAGTLGTFNQMMVAFGVFFACLLQLILKQVSGQQRDYYYIMFGFTLVTVLLQTILLLFLFRFETPKYLLQKNKQEECKQVLSWIYYDQFVQQVLAEKKSDLGIIESPQNKQSVASQLSQKQFSKSQKKHNKLRLFVSIHLAMLQQFVGINAVVIYGTDIAQSILPDLKNLIPVILNLQQTLAALVTGYLLTKLGRKQILQAGTLVSVLSLLFIGIGFFIDKNKDQTDHSFTFASALIIIGLVIFMANFGLSLGPIVWLYIPQILQPDLIPLSTLANWATASLITFLFPILKDIFGTCAYLFLFYAVYSILGFFVSQKFVIETKGKTQKEIYREYEQLTQ